MQPIDGPRAAVLQLGLQHAFLGPDGPLRHRAGDPPRAVVDGIVGRCNSVTRAAVGCGRPVVFAGIELVPGRPDWALPDSWSSSGDQLVRGSNGVQPVAGLEPAGAVPVAAKALSAFQHTILDRLLTNLGVTDLIVVGGPVRSVVSSTVRQGAALGYEQFVVVDATFPAASADVDTLRNRAALMPAEQAVAELLSGRGREQDMTDAREALLVIDVQNDFVHASGAMARYGHSRLTDQDRRRLVQRVETLLAAFRRAGLPVVFVRDVQTAHGHDTVLGPMMRRSVPIPPEARFIVDGTWGADYYGGLEPAAAGPGETLEIEIIKRGNSAFAGTPLHRTLRNLGVRDLIVAGGATAGCVSDSVRDGLGLGYHSRVVTDATYPPGSPYLAVLGELVATCDTETVVRAL